MSAEPTPPTDADRARQEAQAERLLAGLGDAAGLALLVGGQQLRGRRLVHRDRLRLHAVRAACWRC